MKNRNAAFSLVEVVLALGIVSFAIIAILGLIPTGLQTSHSSQDETRAAQIAQSILATFSAQQFNSVTFLQYDANGNQSGSRTYDLTTLNGTSVGLGANNEGELLVPVTPAIFLTNPSGPPSKPADTTPIYGIAISFNNSPAGFDTGYANEVTVMLVWPYNAPAANQTQRDFTRIISKY